VKANPGLVQEIVRDGHTLCNHTWRHDQQLGTRSTDEIRTDLQRTNDEIRRAVPNAVIKYWRHPAGNFTSNSISVARDMGMIPLSWNLDTRDWDTAGHKPGADLTNHVVSMVKENCAPGAIVLSHDGGGDRSSTEAAYRTLLPYLKQQFTLVAMPV
jgi:peptidoglycan/xylan/chitin deacetylase (PgdA/CDA1 family)